MSPGNGDVERRQTRLRVVVGPVASCAGGSRLNGSYRRKVGPIIDCLIDVCEDLEVDTLSTQEVVRV